MADELKEKELETVTGGGSGYADADYIPESDRGAHISQYEAGNYIGHYVYVVRDNCIFELAKGKLVSTCNRTIDCKNQIVHEIDVADIDSYLKDSFEHTVVSGQRFTFCGNNFTLYNANIQDGTMPKN